MNDRTAWNYDRYRDHVAVARINRRQAMSLDEFLTELGELADENCTCDSGWCEFHDHAFDAPIPPDPTEPNATK